MVHLSQILYRLLGGSALVVMLMFAVSAPACAHDTLVGSEPPTGAELAIAPQKVVLTFSDKISPIAPMTAVSVNGNPIFDGELAVQGTNAIVTLPASAPAGDYKVDWSVVSSDGHRIEGTVTFTVKGGEQPAVGDDPVGGTGANNLTGRHSEAASAQPLPAQTAPAAQPSPGYLLGRALSRWGWPIVLGLLFGFGYRALRKKFPKRTDRFEQ